MPWTRGLGGLAPFCNFRTALRAATSYCGSCMEAPSLATSHLTSTRRKSATFDLASRGSVLSARSNNFSGAHTDSSGCVQGTRDPPIESICPFFHQFGFGPKYAPKRVDSTGIFGEYVIMERRKMSSGKEGSRHHQMLRKATFRSLALSRVSWETRKPIYFLRDLDEIFQKMYGFGGLQ